MLDGALSLPTELDTDWYESTRHELQHLYPRLSQGGVLIIDDYGHWKGSRKATDEFIAATPDFGLLTRIDYTAAWPSNPDGRAPRDYWQ